MKAAVARAHGAPFAIEEIEIDAPRDGEVVVEIRAVAICHSDVIYAAGGWGGDLPAIYGHEAAGVVRESRSDRFAAGQRVIVTMIRHCGACICCAAGRPSLCEHGFPRPAPRLRDAEGAPVEQGLRTGAFAEVALVHESQLAPAPDDLPFEEAALLACGVVTGWGAAVNTALMPAGATAAVIGVGGVGLNVVQAASILGASTIVAIDLSDEKLAAAPEFGATETVNPARQDVGAAVRAATGGRGADYVFVAAGARAAIEGAFDLTAPMGAVVLAGIPPSDVRASFDPCGFASGGRRLLGSKMDVRPERDLPILLEHRRAGRLKLAPLISRRFAFDEINRAMDAARKGEGLRNLVLVGERS